MTSINMGHVTVFMLPRLPVWVFSTLRGESHWQVVVLAVVLLFIQAFLCDGDFRASYSNRLSEQLWAALMNNNSYKFFCF